MKRHPFDLVSLVFGVLCIALAIGFYGDATDAWDLNARWIPAVVLIALGGAGVASSVFDRRRSTDLDTPADAPKDTPADSPA